jgi:hypothetical protein
MDDLLVEPGGGGGVGQAVTGDALALGAGGDHVGKGEKAMRLRARRVRLPRKVLRAVPVCRREGRCRLRKKRLGNLATLLVLLLGELLSIALGLLLLALLAACLALGSARIALGSALLLLVGELLLLAATDGELRRGR